MAAAPLPTKRRAARRDAALRAAADKAIAVANSLTDEAFVSAYIQPSESSWPTWTHPRTREPHAVSLRSPGHMPATELAACLALIERTSGDDYRAGGGWDPAAKAAEMRSRGLRYVLVRHPDDGGEVRGFASFMFTWEDDRPVVYCYEIHLAPELEGTGLGALLMGHVMAVAGRVGGMTGTMLTCFVTNERARRFYERLGFVVDASSPRPRRLRDRVVEPAYVIMSRPTTTTEGSGGVDDVPPDEVDGHREKRARKST
ncbi:Acyl-CoA N-acyltransferase [Cordyceps fumosorosea ARSEF 2679]|uniref:N-alpha-acetyltransferase 40 n=1 Tax=Cordyceps fumosorosea (strain ARSEF 2679) TaxID=1081104 RepID=A0A167UGG9_CORFA|nr:Acyl-CoA N-acyltransferase [Cordyceps fumosorosea ARSEF 2679]OAA61555.1 Acyl-CoA N-acyltransferase [Cordyceps fumosorosea ARSEF 2679]